jgi:hypothetical protein
MTPCQLLWQRRRLQLRRQQRWQQLQALHDQLLQHQLLQQQLLQQRLQQQQRRLPVEAVQIGWITLHHQHQHIEQQELMLVQQPLLGKHMNNRARLLQLLRWTVSKLSAQLKFKVAVPLLVSKPLLVLVMLWRHLAVLLLPMCLLAMLLLLLLLFPWSLRRSMSGEWVRCGTWCCS